MTIGRDDLEAKLREIEETVVGGEEEIRGRTRLLLLGVTAVAVALVAYGIWRSRRRQIRVEVFYQ